MESKFEIGDYLFIKGKYLSEGNDLVSKIIKKVPAGTINSEYHYFLEEVAWLTDHDFLCMGVRKATEAEVILYGKST